MAVFCTQVSRSIRTCENDENSQLTGHSANPNYTNGTSECWKLGNQNLEMANQELDFVSNIASTLLRQRPLPTR